jgi:hypothetical protein
MCLIVAAVVVVVAVVLAASTSCDCAGVLSALLLRCLCRKNSSKHAHHKYTSVVSVSMCEVLHKRLDTRTVYRITCSAMQCNCARRIHMW